MTQELVASLLKEFGTVQKVVLDRNSGRKALVKFAYKDSATKAVNTVSKRKANEYSLKYADKEAIKSYTNMDAENDIVGKMR